MMRKELYLAGGCFWGLEAYLDRIEGVLEATSGYANGHTANPTYQDVCNKNTGHAETVHIAYDSEILNLNSLLQYYFRVIDPTSINRQGNDIGSQYRTGIYYVNSEDKKIIEDFIQSIQNNYSKNIVVEVQPLSNFFKAEEYHQKYLKKNPQGYCHIDLSLADMPLEKAVFQKPSDEKLKKELSSLQYNVTQNGATEPPFQNPYWNHFEKGIYVDITTKEPLFVSTDKFHSNCGWPSFSKPIDKETVKYHSDHSHGMERTEVKSSTGDAHLGHVFPDGPAQTGGLRYCINSASLEFIPLSEMEEKGYGAFIHLID